ncbi:2',3'-cyclic-nucleotide 2'-phosphodiesterase/5'-or 3'-nucleotidase, 5'-nucleotidase family [Rhizobium sp. RU35A]|uniref:metallophosphoesterase n=1 Tax=Rhizobium sp. RU35A TaxID=1907414 RepID=UPI00095716E3|nr:metallophosphoesterase [Rhizobium sp. RU35A]SIQ01839.1 2',3'-cyclic-nucleotide 2'-phosphodiesterase/5'-or 3'-nucleotidase, 5'-nucleotidase family [Rhizobium sp. RU35A]
MLLNRRAVLGLFSSAALLPLAGTVARAAEPGVDLIILSDLHSAYERMAELLQVVETRVASASRPQVILFNGDLFESGNVAAARSGGEADWTFLGTLARLAPTVFNIGNHEPDFDNDLAHFVEKARSLGVTVLSNINDKRTGKPYAEASATLSAGGMTLNIAALGTNAIGTYPKATRDLIDVPQPVEWAKANLPAILKSGSVNIVLSHAGVVPDRDILPMLPDATLMIGGHDHLTLVHEQGRTRYVHTGSWASLMTVATITAPGAAATLERISIERDDPAAADLKRTIAAVLDRHLTAEDRSVIARTAKPLTRGETARFTAAAIAAKVGAGIGFIGHTSFGTGLPRGEVSRFDYNAALRFEGKIMKAEVDAATLAAILARCNQDGDVPLSARTGDFLYAAPALAAGKQSYIIACNDWSAINRKAYFGREDLTFAEVPELKLKALVIEALNKA